jgi:hypothetical protein
VGFRMSTSLTRFAALSNTSRGVIGPSRPPGRGAAETARSVPRPSSRGAVPGRELLPPRSARLWLRFWRVRPGRGPDRPRRGPASRGSERARAGQAAGPQGTPARRASFVHEPRPRRPTDRSQQGGGGRVWAPADLLPAERRCRLRLLRMLRVDEELHAAATTGGQLFHFDCR